MLSDRRTFRERIGFVIAGAAAGLVLLGLAGAGRHGPGAEKGVISTDGTGRVELEVPVDPNAPSLIVVSVLNEMEGPWPIEVRARASASVVAMRPRTSEGVRPTRPVSEGLTLASYSDHQREVPAPERAFHVLTGPDADRATSYRTVAATALASGRFVDVYADSSDAGEDHRPLADDIVRTLEGVVLPACDRWIGRPGDVDRDGRFVVLLSSRLAGVSSAEAPVLGFVRPADFDVAMPGPFSNHCDMLYLDPQLKPGPDAHAILAHEYAHATLAGRKLAPLGSDRSRDGEEPWLDEALAHVVESRLGFSDANYAHRVVAFRRAPERSPLVGDAPASEGPSHAPGRRGAGLSFLSFCVDRCGADVVARLFATKERGVAAVEAATGEPFSRLFGEWALTMARGGTGRHGETITTDGPPARWVATGTTFHAVPLTATTAGLARVEVIGPPDVSLRVSIVAAARP